MGPPVNSFPEYSVEQNSILFMESLPEPQVWEKLCLSASPLAFRVMVL